MSVSVPRPTRWSVDLGDARCGKSPRLGERLDRLVALEHPDEQELRRLRAAGAGGRSRNGSRSMNAGNSAAGSTPEASHDVARERREGADPVGLANRPLGERVREGCKGAAQRRAVQAGGRTGVTVQVEDDAGLAPRQTAAQERERGLLRALHEHRVRSAALQLPRDEEGEAGVVQRAVENRAADG